MSAKDLREGGVCLICVGAAKEASVARRQEKTRPRSGSSLAHLRTTRCRSCLLSAKGSC